MAKLKIYLVTLVLCGIGALGQEETAVTPGLEPDSQNTTTTTERPTPAPEVGTWSVTNTTTNVTCIMIQFAATINVTYNVRTADNGTELAHAVLLVPKNATSSGSCVSPQLVTLTWPASPVANNSLQLHYVREGAQYTLQRINLTVVPDEKHFPDADRRDTMRLWRAVSGWAVGVGRSYTCAQESLALGDDAAGVAVLSVNSLREEAYRERSDAVFGAAVSCGSSLPDAVPIAVGVTLAVLVLVVLGAYLVGRRRSQARGYLSM